MGFIFCFVMATSATLVSAQYGKARVRLFKTKKTDTKHFVTNYTVQVLLSGPQFESSFTRSDNSLVIPTDTVKNTIYFKARESFSSPEEFAHLIANHFLGFKHVETVRVEITETMWNRMIVKGSEHPHSFTRSTGETRIANLVQTRSSIELYGGIKDFVVLKTTESGFVGFHKCNLTVLPEVDDRILATNVSATWKYHPSALQAKANFNQIFTDSKQLITDVFATEYSPSVQATLWSVSTKMLQYFDMIEEVKFALPNLHHWEIDFTRFGLENTGEIFVAVDEPHGQIEGTVRRNTSKL